MAVDPIQTGDGSQVTSAGTFRTRGFAPTPTPDITTNVVAPLDVRGAPGQASILAQQLQESLQSMRFPVMEAQRARGEVQAKQNYDQGVADQSAGRLNPELMQADGSYRAGAVQTRVQASYYQWAPQEARKLANDPSFVTKSPEEVQDALDADAKQAFGGLENDPLGARTLAPLLTHFASEVAGYHIRAANEYNANQQLNNIGQGALAAAVHGAPFDYQGAVTTLAKFQGMDAASQNAANAVIQTAVATHQASVLDQIRPAPGQKSLPPALLARVSDARDSINRYSAQQAAQQTQQRQYGILSQWDNSLAAKTPISQSAITEAVNNRDITPEAGLMYQQRSNALREHMQATTAATTAVNSGTPLYTLAGQQIPGAKPGKVYTPELLQKTFDANIDALPQGQRISAAVRGTQQQGYVYSPLASTANNEPLNTAQGVKDVTGLYNGLNSIDASVTGKYFNPKRLAEVRQVAAMKQSGMSDEDIATWVQKHGAPQTPEAAGIKMSQVNAALSSWTLSGPRDHWYTPGLHSSQSVLADTANPGQIVARVRNRAAFLAQSGLCTPDVCVTEAAKQIQDESYSIALPNGRSLVVPMTKSDPPTAITQPALQDFFDNHAAKIAQADGWHGDPSDLRLVPNTVQPGTFTLMDDTGRPVSRDTFTLQGIVGAYQKGAYAKVQAAQQTAAAKASANTAANRTKRDLFQTLD